MPIFSFTKSSASKYEPIKPVAPVNKTFFAVQVMILKMSRRSTYLLYVTGSSDGILKSGAIVLHWAQN